MWMRTRVTRRIAFAALLLCCGSGSSEAGDPDLAEFLLTHGRTAISRGEYDDALTKLHKARSEDETLIEATYLIATVHERKKALAKAVAEYRAFQRLAEAAQREGKLSKSLAKLLSKATGRLKALDAGNTAIDRAQAAFVDKLCLTARTMAATDPNLAIRVLKVARLAAPDHNDARNMLAEMASGAIPLPAAFDRVHDWQDLIKSSLLGTGPAWTYKEGLISVAASGGTLIRPPGGFDSGRAYAYSVDLILMKIPSTERTMSVGLIFAIAKDEGFGFMLFHDEGKDDRVALTSVSLKPPKDRVMKVLKMAKWEPGVRHRLSVLVDGPNIQLFLDNELAIKHKASGRDDLSGTIGISHQNVHLDMRQLRVGSIPKGSK